MRRGSPDYFFIALVIILVVFGLVMLASASSDLAKLKFGDSYYYLKHQILYGLSFGLLGFFFAAFFNYRKLESWSLWILIAGIVLLFLIFTPLGVSSGGAERWLNFGPLNFQPGEFIKLAFLIYLAAWLGKSESRSRSFVSGFLPFLFLSGVIAILLFLQPSTTTAIVLLASSLLTYFIAGARLKFLVAAVVLGAIILGVLIFLTPYRMERILTFLNPERDPLGTGYHLNQAKIAIGSGGLTGVGYGESTTKLRYLPEPIGDSIFAVIAEELGFIGAAGLILVFVLFIWRGFRIARGGRDNFSRWLGASFTSLIGIQAFINIAAISGFFPLTGVPLPFISYGGTALAVFLTMSGLIVNISRSRR